MCVVVYLGADSRLPIIPWEPDAPQFNVSVAEPGIELARTHFSKPSLHYVGSHLGCGCGFNGHDASDDAEKKDSLDSFRRLIDYLKCAIERHGAVELFACWSGEEQLPCKERVKMSVTELKSETMDVINGIVGKNLFLSVEK